MDAYTICRRLSRWIEPRATQLPHFRRDVLTERDDERSNLTTSTAFRIVYCRSVGRYSALSSGIDDSGRCLLKDTWGENTTLGGMKIKCSNIKSHQIRLEGSFSSVSTPISASKCSLFSSFRDRQDSKPFAPLRTQNLDIFLSRECLILVGKMFNFHDHNL